MYHHDASNPLQAERTVLFVSLNGDPSYVDGIVAAKWQVVHARTVQQAERLLERGAIRLGVVAFAHGCAERQLAEFESTMANSGATWVALVQRGLADKPAIQRFVVDHCFDYVTMPCDSERLAIVLGHAYGLSKLREKVTEPPAATRCSAMIGSSEPMQRLFRGIEKCARADAPVFIAGESGTGKELTARAIHERSARADKPFVAINCAAIPPSLLQSELFGHERGAFTGALQRKIGRIEAASGGTLFLDEIGDMPHECQAVLLRFLQEHTIERLGGTASIKVDVRVVSATHVDLMQAIDEGRFRADFYHRLCVLSLDEPPLRERGHDIKLLAAHALSSHRHDGARKIRGFSSDAIAALFNYTWPGNVRELINRVRRAVVMAEGRFITAADLGLADTAQRRCRTLAQVRCEAERAAVREALARHAYSLSGAASELGVSRATLYRLLNAIGLRVQAAGERGSGHVEDTPAERASNGDERDRQHAA